MRSHRSPFCRDFTGGITLRVILIMLLWIWYGLAPYVLPMRSLWIVTGLMLAYAGAVYRKDAVMGKLMILAAVLNTLMIPYWDRQLNLLLSLLVTAILFWDIVTVQQRCGAE